MTKVKTTRIKKMVRILINKRKQTIIQFSDEFESSSATILMWLRYDDRKLTDVILEKVLDKLEITYKVKEEADDDGE